MNGLICPVSSQTIDKNASRVGATITAAALVGYAVTGLWPILLLVAADYVVRVCTPYRSPIAQLAAVITRLAGIPPKRMNKGPKVFAWRVGFLMAVVAIVLLPFSLTGSIITAAGLAAFNLLDGVGNLCVGCAIYTRLVLPFNKPKLARGPRRAEPGHAEVK